MKSGKQYLVITLVLFSMLRGAVFATGEESCEDICAHPELNIPYDQCIALATIYATNGGATWTTNTNRTTAPDVSTWWGVVLTTGTENRQVQELILPANNISGGLPSVIQSLTALSRLDLQGNAVTSLPVSMQSLTQMEELIIANNQLTSLPDIFTNRGSLDLLRAEGNQLTALPVSLGNLYELDLLDVSSNKLTSLPISIGNLDDLDILKVAHNELTFLPNPISNLDQLTLLDAQGNNLAVWPAQIEQLITLESLQLEENSFTTIPAAVFSLPSFHHLNLRNNMLTELPDGWEGSAALQIIDFGVNRLTSLPTALATLDGLRQLYLHENRLTTLPDEFFSLTDLQLAHFAFNTLAGALPQSFNQLDALTYLDVAYNRLDHNAYGDVTIPSSLTNRANRSGFRLNGEGQQDNTATWLTLANQSTFPLFTTTTIVRTVELAPGVRMSLENEEQPTGIVSGSGAMCAHLTASLILTASGTYELSLQPQLAGVYEGCLLQLVDQWGELTAPREIPTITVVTEMQATFCDDPALTIEKSACLALLKLFIATNGVNWTRSTGWFVHPRVEEWYGIQTELGTQKRKITGLFLHSSNRQPSASPLQGTGNNLSGVLPDIFADFPDLVHLSLGNNKLTGELPPSLGSLENLAYLYIQNNQFVGALDEILPGLVSLRRMSVQQNDFSGELHGAFSEHTELEAVDVRNNSFGGLLPVFAPDAPIFYFQATENDFIGELPEDWATYPTRQYLYLAGNELEGTIPPNRSTWASLLDIDVSSNALDRTPDKSAVLKEDLVQRWQARTQKFRGNQRDLSAPAITLLDGRTDMGTGRYQLTFGIEENNYAVDALDAGMAVVIGGGEGCSDLIATDIRVSTGTTTTVITPSRAGIFEDCTLTVLDHGQNYSNTLELPLLGHDLGAQEICLHPNLSIPLDECRALWDFYITTSGENRINTNNRWLTPAVNTWFGVQTIVKDGQHHVSALLFHRNELTSVQDALVPQSQGNNLQGTLPDSLRDLPELRHIRLDHNNLTGSPRDALVGMEYLETLTLAHNQFEGILPTHRGGFTSLKHLDLAHNAFTGSLPSSWKGLPDLEKISLAHNDLGGVIEVASGDRGALTSVDVSANNFSGTLDADRSTQRGLKEFLGADNSFGGALPAQWGTLTGLTKLDITNNNISGPLPTAWQSLSNVEVFLASGNALYGDINTVFPVRGALQKLDITGNKFTGRMYTTRTTLTELEELLVRGNNLDRTQNHEAMLFANGVQRLATLTVYDISQQSDVTNPKITSSTILRSPVMNAQEVNITWDENSYATNALGSGLQMSISGGGACASVLINTGVVTQMTGTMTILLQPQVSGVHTCWLTLTDHAGNVGRLQLTPFLYDPSCGDSEIVTPEQCDEGRFCQNDENIECTQDMSLCSFSCTTLMVDNCTPACKQSVCGDRYLDTNGLDNIGGTQDDELCDVGSFCADGRDCTANPSICPGGAAGCKTRFTPSCSPVCAPSSCGDGVVDEDGENNLLDDEDDEDCDDANMISGDGCSSSCKVEYCGDGFIDANGADQLANTADDEACDVGPGNGLRAGQCNQFCKVNEQTCQWCFETCQGGTGHHSIYLLIDVSGSMEGNKMQKAKQGAIDFVQHIMSGSAVNSGFVSKVGLIKFSSNGTVVHQPTTNYQQLITSISALQPGGSTNFGDPLNDAKNYFATNDGGYEKHIVLLSDGLPTVGTSNMNAEEYAVSAADAIKASGVRLYTIAVEQTEEGIEFMRSLSSAAYVNLAAGRSPTQSSTQSSNSASRAVDANKDNYAQTKNDAKAWWQVDLGSAYEVREVKVRNRTNLGNQTSNFYVFGSATPFTSTNLTTTLAQSGVIAQYYTGTAQRPTTFLFDDTIRYVRVQLAGTNRLQLAEVEIFGCDGTENCDWVFSFEDYTSEAITTLYGHIFGSIHCGCGPYQVCGVCGDGVVDPTYGEVCDEGSSCDDGRACSADPSICPTECRPRTSQSCTQLCQLPSCGDGVVQTGLNEQCDDGNQRIGDGCSATCTIEVCGDSVIDSNGIDQVIGTADDEQCDDGNLLAGDGCSSTCKSEFCGDGDVLGSELCDTGRSCEDGTDCTDNPWICPGQCQTRFVAGCTPDCTYGYCGDLIIDSDGVNNLSGDTDDEQCDPGKFCPNGIPCSHDASLCPGACEVTFTPTCTDHCKTTYCGDGFVDLDGVDDDLGTTYDNEYCDDANGINGDGCSSTCMVESESGCIGTSCVSTCQDGIKQFFEPCDPTDPTDELSAECTQLCTLAVCGDGIVWEDEQCDAGKRCDDMITSCTDDPTICPTGPGECQPRYIQGCTEDCFLGCGDGTVQSVGRDGITGTADDELCDDGNTRNTDTCTNTCKRPQCGDGIVTYYAQIPSLTGGTMLYYETCDDGNNDDGDDCPSTCIGSGVAMTGQCSSYITPYTLYGLQNFSFDDITQFCEAGIPDGSPVYNEQLKEWQWICHGILGGADSLCVIPSWSCGDGVVDVWADTKSGISAGEGCDDGNKISGDGCTSLCQVESPLLFTQNLCTSVNYPTVQPGEVVPLWREATVAQSYTGTCATAPTNTLIDREKMICTFAISRGHPDGYKETVGYIETACLNNLETMTGGTVLRDAISDQGASPQEILGGITTATTELTERIQTSSGISIYGQYSLDLVEVTFPYCALTRTNSEAGTEEVVTERQVHTRTYTHESLCAGTWTVLPGYMMQQKVLFSEQPNTGLDLTIIDLSGNNLYLADSSYDQSDTLVTYNGPEKSYLFDEIIEKYRPLATQQYVIATANDSATIFKKVPNTQVYVYTEQYDLVLERAQIEHLLMQGGVASTQTTTTPFTIIVPDARSEIHLVGDIPGRGMYVARDDIQFVAQNCDTNDVVQGLFVTNGQFSTTSTINNDISATARCNRGGLTIDGLLLGGDISATLGNVRRATLNLWENEEQRYAGAKNKSYLADQFYRLCMEVPLLHDAFAKTMNTTIPLFGGMFSGCSLETSEQFKELQTTEGAKLINNLFKPAGFFDKAVHEQNTLTASTFLKLLEHRPTGMSAQTTTKVTVFTYKDSVYTIQIPAWKMQQIASLGKTLPGFWGTSVNLNDAQVRDTFLERIRGAVGPVGELMKKIIHPLEGSPSLHHLLVQHWGSGYTQTLLSQVDTTTNGICTGSLLGADNRLYIDQTSCLLTYTPLYRWMIDSMQTYKLQKIQKDEKILDGASVQIRSAPFLRQSPPPGARDLLQAMQISF